MTSRIIPGNVQNVVTEYRYGPGGQLVEVIAKNPVTGDQVTRYEYGTTLKESGIASNNLLRAEIYPDAKDSSDRVSYSYNRQGQRTRMADQNGSVHEYEHDLLGRQTADKVTTLGDGVDGAVRRIGTTYEVRGMVEKVTSYSDAAGTAPVNEVQNVYNSFGQLKEQYQEHSGAVNTSTTPKVQYGYADGSANTTRPTSMTYPNGRVLDYLYDDTHADKLSRIRTLRFDGTDVCRYAYLGLNTFVTTDYPQPQVKLDYALGSGANPYTGFDRFGRIIDLLWAKYGLSNSSSSSSSGGAGNDLVHLKYGYDRASNRTFREDLVAQAYGKDFDELYEYDGLHRLKKFHRGRLTDDNRAITSPTLQQGWHLDATGNWRNFTQNDQADPDQTLDQQRLANRVNEITQIARTVGADWATPEYDRNGNMTVIPQPKEMTQTFQGAWDAWNRLVKLKEPNGSGGWQTLAEYQYDGQTWRTAAKSYASGVLDETRHFYFTSRWQDIEERLGTTPSSATANRQFVWGQRYIDDLVLRDRDTGGGSLDERLYALQDANWNVVAIADTTATIEERYNYVAYGISSAHTASFAFIMTGGHEWEVGFAGYRSDLITLLNHVRHRYLQCNLGEWLSRDPFLAALRNGADLEYVGSNPLTDIDPFGLFRMCATFNDGTNTFDEEIECGNYLTRFWDYWDSGLDPISIGGAPGSTPSRRARNCAMIRAQGLISSWAVVGWRFGSCRDTYYVRPTDYSVCGCSHVDLWAASRGEIRGGLYGNPTKVTTGTPNPPKKTDWVLRRSHSPSRIMKWGIGAGKTCQLVTDAEIVDCAMSRPAPTTFCQWITGDPGAKGGPCTNCRTDISDTVSECCLYGF
jgi:RHS repeat-associated protein